MPSTIRLSQHQRDVLTNLLQARLLNLERERTSQLEELSQVESARQTLLQDADDAPQRAGAQEVEGIVADIDSGEFNAISDALQRIHGAAYGQCVDCQMNIPFERLQIQPQALRCLDCQNLHERNTPPHTMAV